MVWTAPAPIIVILKLEPAAGHSVSALSSSIDTPYFLSRRAFSRDLNLLRIR